MQIMEATDINFEVYEMGNKPTNEAQRVDVKNGVICLFFMFTLRVVVIKMSKMQCFSYFYPQYIRDGNSKAYIP